MGPYRRPPPPLNSGGATGPVGLAQNALDELAGGVAREGGVEGDLARNLVVGEVRAAEGPDLVGGEGRAGARLDGGVDALAPVVVGHAEDGGVLDLGVAVKHVLDLGGVDVDAARDDHVALAVADVDEPLVVEVRDVAHAEPVAPRRLARGVRVLVVLVEHAGVAAHVQLARLPDRARGGPRRRGRPARRPAPPGRRSRAFAACRRARAPC